MANVARRTFMLAVSDQVPEAGSYSSAVSSKYGFSFGSKVRLSPPAASAAQAKAGLDPADSSQQIFSNGL